MPPRNLHRNAACPLSRRLVRCLPRPCVRRRWRGPDDLAQALTAFGRALRAHRRLARLAPRFFDAAVVARERENRAEQRRWMALWEPHLAKAYGVAPQPPPVGDDAPPLPPPATQRAVDCQLAELQSWLAAGDLAFTRHQQRQPHALLSLGRIARLLQLAFDLKRMVLGLDSKNPLPDKITYDYEFTDLKRAYGHLCDSAVSGVAPPTPPAPLASGAPPAPVSAAPGPGSGNPPAAGAAFSPPPAPAFLRPPALAPPESARCDAWSRLARQLRK